MVEENSVAMDQPPRISPQVADALEHLASIDLLELCKEAKVERCRATRDLSSCGRYVQDVLNSCGHASLCAECSKRCDMCPICRASIPYIGNRIRPRLYYECANAGLISKRYAERFHEKDDSKDHFLAIQCLYSLFDVALDNNLVSLICHYVTDVCMDESAVSSDPFLSFLLDEVVVKDWCKQRFKAIIHDLQIAYRLDLKGMKSNLCSFQKSTSQLAGISNVLEVMVSSFKDNLSAQLNDLHFLLDNTMKTKQHLEIMIWCIHHEFLENVLSHYPDDQSWALHVLERKSKAIKQSWPDSSSYLAFYGGQSEPALFIEQALSNLEIEESYGDKHDDIDISCLKDANSPRLFSSKINESYRNQASACYPFNHVRAAADIIFLQGASDMVVAKRAIFLYYLFDRHWTLPDAEWRYLVDDFASSFGIGRLQMLESFVFYLLDDHTDQALQEACVLLPEIAGPDTHSKIAQVLLERQHPYVALNFLRYTGRDGGRVVLLDEAVTVLRIKIECGLLTEAFMYISLHCDNLKGLTSKQEPSSSNSPKSDLCIRHKEVLVTEMCSLCMRRNLVDRIIEFPWDSTEEKYIHNCLLQHAHQNPSSNYGSILVVFYLQRCRYVEAYQVHRELQILEQNCLEKLDEEIACHMKSMCHGRSLLVDKCLDLLPEDQRKQVITSSITETNNSFNQNDQMDVESASEAQLNLTNISSSSRKSPSLVLHTNSNYFPSTNTLIEAPMKQYTSFGNAHNQQRLLTSFGSPHNGSQVIPQKNLNANPLQIPGFGQQSNVMCDSNEARSYDSARQFEESNKPSTRITCRNSRDVVNISGGQSHMKDAVNNHPQRNIRKQNQLDGPKSMITSEQSTQKDGRVKCCIYQSISRARMFRRPCTVYALCSEDCMLIVELYASVEKSEYTAEQSSMKVGFRWRSDESTEDQTDQIDKHLGGGSTFAFRRRTRHFRRRPFG